MNYINQVELLGGIGSIKVAEFQDGNSLANISLATESAYKQKDGTPVVSTTWHNVVVKQSVCNVDIKSLQKGMRLHVQGKLANRRYTDTEGVERTVCEIIAFRAEFVNETGPLGYSR